VTNKKRPISFYILAALIGVAFLADVIAHEPKPTDWLKPLIPYAPTTQQTGENRGAIPPSVFGVEKPHFFGTDAIGRDVAAGVIHGTRSALMIGIGGMLLAVLIGLPIGLMAGFFGDDRLKVPFWQMILRGVFFLYTVYFVYVSLHLSTSNWLFTILTLFFILILGEILIKLINTFLKITQSTPTTHNSKLITHNSTFPFDLVLMRLVEIIQAVPLILWLMAALTIIGAQKLTIAQLIILIGATGWINFAQLARGEMLRIRNLEFMQAAETIGMSHGRQMLKHALPNIISPILVAFAFGVSNGILLEASLSFIGLGLPAEQVTWGSLLSEARHDFENWWLVVFPGLAIFLAVYTLNQVGKNLR
jgi:peptide/nickel transport system permease protein